MKKSRLALATLLCSVPLLAAAQWQWLDKDGRKVFSDRAPPAEIPDHRVLQQPGGRAPAATAAAAPAGAPEPLVPKLGGIDPELEKKKKLAEAAEAEKRKAEQAKFAAARADNCTRARSAKASYDSGLRIARVNAKGEREFLDDKQRQAEVQRLETVIARDCAAP